MSVSGFTLDCYARYLVGPYCQLHVVMTEDLGTLSSSDLYPNNIHSRVPYASQTRSNVSMHFTFTHVAVRHFSLAENLWFTDAVLLDGYGFLVGNEKSESLLTVPRNTSS